MAALLAVAATAALFGPRLVADQIVTIDGPGLISGLALSLVTVTGVASASRLVWAGPRARSRIDLAGVIVLESGVITLATAWFRHDQVVAGSIAAGVALLVPVAAAAALIARDHGFDFDAETVRYSLCFVVFEGAAITFAVVNGLHDRPTGLGIFVALATLPPAGVFGWSAVTVLRTIGSGDSDAPLPYQLAGLIVPTTAILTALLTARTGPLADRPGSLFNVVAVTAGMAVALAAVQRFWLGWLTIGPVGVGESVVLGKAEVDRGRRAELEVAKPNPDRRRRDDHERESAPIMARDTADLLGRGGSLACALAALLTGFTGQVGLLAMAVPLAIAFAFFLSLRARVSDLYRLRADVVEIYRFDLARRLHVPIPRDPEVFVALASTLTGARPPDELDDGRRPAETHTHRAAVDIGDELGQIRRQQQRLERLVGMRELSPEQLAGLADRVAERTAEPVAEILGERLEHLVHQSIEAAVVGPALVDFTGFMALDLVDGGGRAGEVIRAPAGGVLEMRFSIVRDDPARNAFLITEPIEIEGGRAEPLVEFEAVADSPTLRPQPGRETLLVAREAASVFSFAVPDRPERHQIWFQLYQGGRLIQAIAVDVEAEHGSVGE